MNSNENNQNQSQNTVSSQVSTPQSTSIINPSTVTEISKIKNIPTIQPSVASPITTPESTIPVSKNVSQSMQQFSKTSSKKRKIIPIIILVVAIIILIIFVLNKYGKSTNNKIGTKLENVSLDGHICTEDKCIYCINRVDENLTYDYVYKLENKELFEELNEYKEYVKVNIYYIELIGKKYIKGYEIIKKDDNKDISDVKNTKELREKIGLYALGTHTDELTLKAIGKLGVGMNETDSYTFKDYEFENNKGHMYKMRYIFKKGESSNDLNLEIDSKYNITFEVVDETVRIEYYIKSFN